MASRDGGLTDQSTGGTKLRQSGFARGVALTAVGEFEMAYIVQADDSEGDAISITVADRKEALAAAVEWATEGRSGIKISAMAVSTRQRNLPGRSSRKNRARAVR
jgi:hypothetical protein